MPLQKCCGVEFEQNDIDDIDGKKTYLLQIGEEKDTVSCAGKIFCCIPKTEHHTVFCYKEKTEGVTDIENINDEFRYGREKSRTGAIKSTKESQKVGKTITIKGDCLKVFMNEVIKKIKDHAYNRTSYNCAVTMMDGLKAILDIDENSHGYDENTKKTQIQAAGVYMVLVDSYNRRNTGCFKLATSTTRSDLMGFEALNKIDGLANQQLVPIQQGRKNYVNEEEKVFSEARVQKQ